MIVPDANLLLYAYDSASPDHDAAREWWESCLSGDEAVGLTHVVLFAFLRIATSARIYEEPLPLETATTHIRSWRRRGVTELLQPAHDHVDRVADLLVAARSSGSNLVTDAQIAALAQQYRGTVHTADTDFRRFPDVDCAFPLSAR